MSSKELFLYFRTEYISLRSKIMFEGQIEDLSLLPSKIYKRWDHLLVSISIEIAPFGPYLSIILASLKRASAVNNFI